MDLLKVRPGEVAIYNGRVVIIKQVELKAMQAWCDYTDTNERVLVSFAHLNAIRPQLAATSAKNSYVTHDLSDIPPEKLLKANRKKQIVLAAEVNNNPAITPKERKVTIREIARANGLHRATVYRHIKKYKEGGREERALVEKVKGGKGEKRLAPKVEKIINQAIETIYLTQERNSRAATYEEVRRLCYRNQIEPVPSYDTLRRRINAISEGTIVRQREGEKRYRELFHVSKGSVCDEDDIPYPLHTIEIDGSPVDGILVDEYFRQPLGRPYLTLAVDVYSRAIVGFNISFDPTSADSVAQCIAHSVCGKEEWLAQMGVEGQWPCWGIPDRFRIDNGSEFKNNAYKGACNNYDIKIAWRNHVEDGAVIERLIGTCMREIHSIPGTTKSNIQQKGDYESEKKAALTLKAFEKWFIWWTIQYNNRVHKGIGMPPIQKYVQAFSPLTGPPLRAIPDYITNPLPIRLDFAPFVERTIQHKGVVADHIWYYDSIFRWFKHERRNQSYKFRRLPSNVGSLWLRDPTTNEYIEIKYSNVKRPPLSIWELRAAKKWISERQIEPDEETIFAAVEARRAIVLEELAKRKTVRLTVTTNRILGIVLQTNPLSVPKPVEGSMVSLAAKLDETSPILSDVEEPVIFNFIPQ